MIEGDSSPSTDVETKLMRELEGKTKMPLLCDSDAVTVLLASALSEDRVADSTALVESVGVAEAAEAVSVAV